jgi:predicted MFS family arabinose efflux permease
MPALPGSRPSPGRILIPLVVANGATVSTLYWAQSVVTRAAAEFGPSADVRLMPGATFAGYAAGVALLASVAGDLTAPKGLGRHVLLLVASLSVAAAAPRPLVAALACFFIGLGCSLTQRLLACAASAVGPECRAETIGWIIAGGLCGIVLARAAVPAASELLGWRAMFWLDAALAAFAGLAATRASAHVRRRSRVPAATALPTAAWLWRREVTLRQAAIQQALVFAAFNLGWAIFPRLLAAEGTAPSVPMGIVASLGAAAALLSGRICGTWSPAGVARTGFAAVAVAVFAFVFAWQSSCYIPMALLDIGTQVALVANHARAQALASSPAMRGRLAAIVTAIGFAGGAVGAAIGNLLV